MRGCSNISRRSPTRQVRARRGALSSLPAADRRAAANRSPGGTDRASSRSGAREPGRRSGPFGHQRLGARLQARVQRVGTLQKGSIGVSIVCSQLIEPGGERGRPWNRQAMSPSSNYPSGRIPANSGATSRRLATRTIHDGPPQLQPRRNSGGPVPSATWKTRSSFTPAESLPQFWACGRRCAAVPGHSAGRLRSSLGSSRLRPLSPAPTPKPNVGRRAPSPAPASARLVATGPEYARAPPDRRHHSCGGFRPVAAVHSGGRPLPSCSATGFGADAQPDRPPASTHRRSGHVRRHMTGRSYTLRTLTPTLSRGRSPLVTGEGFDGLGGGPDAF